MRVSIAVALLLLSFLARADVWVADTAAVYRIDPSLGQVILTIPAARTLALAVDPVDKGPWVLSDASISKLSSLGATVFILDLKTLDMDGATVLALDGRDGSAWLGEGGGSLAGQSKSILHVSATGTVLQKFASPGQIVGIAVALDQSVWVLGAKSLFHYTATGTALANIDLSPMVSGEPKLLQVDSISAYILASGGKRVLRVDAHTPAGTSVLGALPFPADALALDEAFGSFYALAAGSIYPIGVSGLPGAGISLSQFGISGATAAAFDSASQKLFVGHAAGVTRLERGITGALSIPMPNAAQIIGVAPLQFATTLQVLAPATGIVTNRATPTFRILLTPTCSGNPCNFAPAFYGSYSVSALLNSQQVGPSFALTQDTGVFGFTPSTRLPEGPNTFVAHVTDIFGQASAEATASFVVDTIAPTFIALTPASPLLTNQRSVHIAGHLDEKATLLAGSASIAVSADNSFSFDQAVVEGLNTIVLQATDLAGNSSSQSLVITVDTTPPAVVIASNVAFGTPTASGVPVTGAAGSVEAGARVRITNLRSGETTEVLADAQGAFSAVINGLAGDQLQIVALDAAGNASAAIAISVPGPALNLPPDPATVATVIDQTAPPQLSANTAFLYSGANPIQTGVVAGTIQPRRAAVVRGSVVDRNGTPLPGVKVRVLDHSEYGQTLSRADGKFDLAVNGGGGLTLVYEKDGAISVQRAVQVLWQDFARAPTVAMTLLDSKVSVIDLTAAVPQVARGNTASDSHGVRQATVLFPPGTTATMKLPNGSTQSLTTLSVRATEYTVGPNGPKAMPGPLPPTSGYTYAVELSVDEAIAAGALEVTFSQALPVYVDNFLNFPIGTIVPAGYYDRAKASWIASKDGRVMKVLSVTNGSADLDVKGQGVAADATLLAKFGISDIERQQIASLFAAGKSFWRVPTAHFSPWDHNLPFGPPSDATSPTGCDDEGECVKPEEDKECEPCQETGSVIEAENQTLGERIPLAGTPFTLNYRSDRVPGYRANYRVQIPLSGATIPASLKRIDLTVLVAGQVFEMSFPAAPNQRQVFDWNGKDAYGRDVPGKVPVQVTIGYVYAGNYQSVATNDIEVVAQNFGKSWGAPMQFNEARGEVILTHSTLLYVRSKQRAAVSQGLGGWTIDVNHIYDPVAGGTLLLGDGTTREVQNVYMSGAQSGLNVGGVAVDPIGNIYAVSYGCCGLKKIGVDGSISTVASVNNFVLALLVSDPAGNLYTTAGFFGKGSIYRINPDGSSTLMAGDLFGNLDGTGVGPALKAVIRPTGLAVGRDGSIYFTETTRVSGNFYVSGCFVKKLATDGIITVIAGDGSCSTRSGDGGPASQATLSSPGFLTLDRQGNLYFGDGSVVRKISTDGIIRNVAGLGVGSCPDGGTADGLPATSVCLGTVRGITFDNFDNLLIASDSYFTGARDTRVRKVRSDGIVSTVAGPGAVGCSQGGGVSIDLVGPAQIVCPTSLFYALAVNANNDIVAGVGTNVAIVSNRQTKWAGLQGTSIGDGEGKIPSVDGKLLYVFNAIGKHARTMDTRTNAALYQFGYDSAGLLLNVQDGDGNVTSIVRDAAGKPTAIVGPYGHRTEVSLDPNGYLASAANPLGETHRMVYDDSGLLKSFQSPKGTASTFTYDVDGRLQRDQDAAGGYWQLGRALFPNNSFEVTMTSAEGRVTRRRTDFAVDGGRKRTTLLPDGTQVRKSIGADGVTTTNAPNGTVTTSVLGPDPRFGMQSPIHRAFTATLPSGLSSSASVERTASLSSAADPLSVTQVTTIVKVNGRTFKTVYDAQTRQFTDTSAEGRVNALKVDTQGRPVVAQLSGVADLTYGYDQRGRLATMTQGGAADARSLTIAYGSDGDVQSVTDVLSRQLVYQRDAAGRVKQATYPGGAVIGFGYDANGNLTSITPPGRPAHAFHFSAVDLNDEYLPPQSGLANAKTQYSHNLDRQLTSLVRPDGSSIALRYDGAGKAASITPSQGAGNAITFVYYPTSGQVKSVGAGDVSLEYAYDGPLLKQETFAGAVSASLARTFDADFRVAGLAVNGVNVAIAYDRDNLFAQVGALTFTRNPASGFVTATALGGVTTSHGYNAFGELASIGTSFGGSMLHSITLGYDPLSRVISKIETTPGSTANWSYKYDLAGRLESVTQNGQLIATYGYDTNGNRTHRDGALVATYDDQDRIVGAGATTYLFTPNGELRQKSSEGGLTQYVYDAWGTLRSVTLPDNTLIEYIIDGRSRRVGKRVNGVVVKGFVYQSQLKIAAELDGAGNVVTRFNYGPKINVPEYMVRGGTNYRIVTDHLGSVRLVVNALTGAVMQRIDYDEFGKVVADSNPGFQPFGFAGGIYDPQTGLVRFGARDYDAETGRWIEKDPAGFAGGDTNLYAYAGGNPTSNIDPWGLDAFSQGGNSGIKRYPSPTDVFQPGTELNDRFRDATIKGLQWLFNEGEESSKEAKPKPKPDREQKPEDCPAGTKPIDEDKRTKDDVHPIKVDIGAGPKDWVGVDPEGNVWTNENGKGFNWGDYSKLGNKGK